ncbi:hypothetical protein BGX21_006080, partial [Mortierella sp. AD011]
KDAFETALKSKFPNVCRCKTEVDLCIGIECTVNADCYVVSGDSDLLVYQNVEKVLRPIPKRHHEFALHEKDDILNALDLLSPTHLLLYGIISDNDYSMNVRNLDLSRNADIVAGTTEASVPNMLKEYLRIARSVANVNEVIKSSRFDNSLNVFYNLQQTMVKQQIDNNDFLGYHKQMTDAMKTRSQLRNQNQSLRGQFYVPKRAKPNRYRPVFSCKEAMLPPKHYDVLKTREHDREQSATQTKKSGKKNKDEKGKEKKEEREGKKEKKKRKKRKNKGKAKWTKKTEQTRNIHAATKKDQKLKQLHPIVALTTGTIKKMADNGIPLHGIAIIQSHFQTCVRIRKELQQRTFWAYALWIGKILRDGSKDVQQKLDAVVDSTDFIYGVASIMYHDDMGNHSNYK